MDINLSLIGRYASENGAEIPAFDAISEQLFVVAGDVVEILNLSDTNNITKIGDLPLNTQAVGDGFALIPNSVAVGKQGTVSEGIIAVALAIVESATGNHQRGEVQFFDASTGEFLGKQTVGFLPDMVTFSPDGTRVLSANEGEPNEDYSFDPEGSVSIIDLSSGVANATVQEATFTAFNSQIDQLRSEGVRIFGPNATVAQDVEPEYIAFSGDGTKAWVTLQENNAIAIVDIATATVESIQPLGFKDHSVNSSTLETYEIDNLPSIGTTIGNQEILLGGFSGLFFEGKTADGKLKYITHTDRGPNGEPTGSNRPFLLPDFSPEIVRLELDQATGEITITERVSIKQADGTPITGLPNISIPDGTGNTPYNDEIPVDLNNEVITPLDAVGADLEGIVMAEDGTFWMVDEYRPAIYHFNTDGTLIDRFVPEGTGVAGGGSAGDFGIETLPAVIAQRRQNRGFEAVALDSDNNKLYAFVQSPIRNPDTLSNGTLNGLNNIRIVEFDLTTQTTTAEYLYRLDNPDLGTEGNSRADKIGDAVYIGNGEFLVVERDDDAIDSDPSANIEKKVYRFSLDGATNITNQSAPIDLGDGVFKTVDEMTPEELASQGINLINKNLYVDLNQVGYNTVEKVEGLAYMGDNSIAVINDNDFRVAGITLNGDGTFTLNDDYTPEPVTLGIIQVQSNGLDASDRDDAINIVNHPVLGMYLPDAIASYTVNGETYYVTANEGDARLRPTGDDVFPDLEEGDLYNEESGVDDLILDPVAFPNFRELQEDENLGRLNVTNTLGQSDRAVFVSELDGSQEVPPVTTEAEGEALAWVDNNGFLQVELEVTGLDFGALTGNPLTESTADDVTLLHIHEAFRGANGGVVWDILEDADTVITIDEDGTANLTSTWQENTIEKTAQGEDTEYYFNLHTTGNPGGEIRGQIIGEIAYDELYAFGTRSFTIWDSEGNLVFDSGDDFERITAQAFPDYFNASNSNNDFDNRSDNKGPEPEGVTVGTIYGETYAFVGLERIGGVMVYNVTNPETPEFVQYINTRDFEQDPETNLTDSGPEGLIFISAQDSPNGKPLLVVSNEVSNTTNVFELDAGFTPPNQPAQVQGLETFEVEPVFTVGEIVANGNGEYYVPPGILDGLGAFALDDDTVRVLANHELSSDAGYAYTLANGTQLTGGRVSFFDINKDTRELEGAGLAYDTIINRAGEVVDEASDLDFMGLDRLCSAQYIIANQFGDNRGLVDGLFFTGEETDGGTEFVLDPESNTLYAVPWMGRAAWESVTQLDTGTTDKVALLIGDDRGGAPLLLYVGEKGQGEGPDILVRNGLAQGKLYVWTTDNGDIDPSQFNGTKEGRSGSFVEIDFYRPELANTEGYDSQGFATQEKQDALAEAVGAFKFSRPEDLATNPQDGTIAVLASTGRDSLFPEDSWGTTYQIDVDFADLNNITAQADIFYDGDDAGNGQFESPDFGLRSPDNLEWATNGLIYIQEDRSFGEFGLTSGEEASIWELSPETGILTRVAQIDRTAVPEGQTDGSPDDIGNWESSGIIDVSSLFDETPGSLFLFDVQAHSLQDGVIEREGLVQGGQLAFFENTDKNFTLQLLHASDQEAGIPALQDAIGFSAVMNALDANYENTLKLTSGDLFIAGPFFNASLDIYGQQGIADILIQNELGWDAAAVGNHEFDAGPSTFYNMLAPNAEIEGVGIDPETGYLGALFPYLATNLDYSTDSSNLKNLVVESGEAPLPNSLTESTVIDVNGEQVGVIGAVVPYLPQIANIGGITMLTDPNSRDIEVNAQLLADNIQPFVDELISQGINKIVLMTHLQQFEIEQALATKLTGVDIIMGGGSHRVMANTDDPLREDETQTPPELLQPYPQVFQDADGNDVYLINTGANYRYLGQLIVEFDPNGQIIEIGDDSGTFATDIEGVDRLYEEDITTFEQVKEVANPEVVAVVDNVGDFINSKDGTIFGNTEVWLNGFRSSVRTEETNLGNLTADANLWYAEQYDFDIDISVKNGGGIRDQIGVSFIDGGTNELVQLPPQANLAVGKEEGDVSQLDIENSLRFNNILSVADISAQGIKDLAEHFVAQWAEGATPGQFGQIGGFSFSFDPDNTAIEFIRDDNGLATGVEVAGERIQNLVLNREDGTKEVIFSDGEFKVDPNATYKMVILDFLATGGDGYPAFYFENVVRLDTLTPEGLPNNSNLPIAGEQDALAEYLAEFHPTAQEAFNEADTPISEDTRIQNLNFRDDTILDDTDPLLNDQIYRFRTGNGTYLYVGAEERQSILQSNFGFVEEGEAFKASFEDDDELTPIYRFRNTNLTGSYLYVGEEERQNLLNNNNFGFVQEGLAFYTYGADAQQGEDIYRFSTVPGGYILVGNEERQSIVQNYSSFTQEGIAFEALA
ncbi:choice-of-anchor I domain-containing protein [Geminocystis sp. NIES-3709]|uniref:choice-of-anchor I domain-containing protein n=1 Tax=Geminocystis sp. NIES-3709 TaxID=1617448 RepID=UPI0005FCCED0|nr:esterase-like activity of phytase family protein [Geminocystis sp. NIES-3709]BAQ66145.1 alkaline phosphatase [Geminocystis sp. NIES-3709]